MLSRTSIEALETASNVDGKTGEVGSVRKDESSPEDETEYASWATNATSIRERCAWAGKQAGGDQKTAEVVVE